MGQDSPEYSLGSNVMYSLRMHWKTKKSTLIYCAIGIAMGVMLPFVGMLLPKLVIDELTARAAPAHFIRVVGSVAAVLILLNYVKSYTDSIVNDSVGIVGAYDSSEKKMIKQMTMDYELMEHPDVKALEEKALRASQSNHSPACNIPRTLVRLSVNLLGFILYGSVIAAVSPLRILLLALSAAINWFFLSAGRSYEKRTRKERALLNNQLWYIQNSAKDPAGAKDIRLYSMSAWLQELFHKVTRDSRLAEGKVAARNRTAQLVDSSLILVRDGAAYAFLLYLLLHDRISLGDFVFIFAVIGAFAGWISGILLQASELFRASHEMSDIRCYLDIPDVSNTGLGFPLSPGSMSPPDISLSGVSYAYPNAEADTLHNISIEIKPGERIAIVGVNGAGKTTLVKLLCGLYKPKSGTIRLGGVEVGEYNRDDYFTLFSTVFQDIHLITTDIAGNISQAPPELTDLEKVERCLRLSGLYDRVQELPRQEKTLLVRRVNEEAVELSGGEKQKLALARALYKDAPVIILDEPTAALDPIAESEIYQKYAELTQGRTSIYISHRLASTRFCDRILLIDNHAIAEVGSHDELMRLNGKYASMFEIQAHYYQENGEAIANGRI